jgi:hypothetical protein
MTNTTIPKAHYTTENNAGNTSSLSVPCVTEVNNVFNPGDYNDNTTKKENVNVNQTTVDALKLKSVLNHIAPIRYAGPNTTYDNTSTRPEINMTTVSNSHLQQSNKYCVNNPYINMNHIRKANYLSTESR